MQNFKHELRWNGQRVANLLTANGIRGRYALAKRLNLNKTTVYLAFTQHWTGSATHNMIAALAAEFGVPVDYLVDVAERQAAA
ncbi:Cro protein [Mycobacterium phage Marshawn]|uniref:Cro protein n=1 Tax=Mycobacterium phage Marshawn TaxID=2652423 RepID=A0A5P8D733_9CAUD|nr:transcriptional repressor [Mycobacterium phage Marshawn]QFP94833.1 Cro protein [Mycobacterium phage Marshawn]